MPATLTRKGSPPNRPAQPLSVSVMTERIAARRACRRDSSARKKNMTGTSKEAGWVMHCSGVFRGSRDVSGDALQLRFDEVRQLAYGLTDEAVPLVFSAPWLDDERGGFRMRCADRHDAALWRDIAFAFMQRDRRDWNGVTQPRQRMIAEVE